MKTLPIEPFGLRLVLGGGIRLVSRGEGIPGSTTILIRGAPGTGKTVLGVHLATQIARLLTELNPAHGPRCDVAYGCVELLPPELAAIVEGLEIGLQVESAPFATPSQHLSPPRILAGVLNIGDRDEEQRQLPAALEDLVGAAVAAGANPRVVVLDSLSDGYRLGASVPRALADEICKTAASAGRVFVLLEESTDSKPSPWCFAADVVIELSLKESKDHGGAVLPSMLVTKHRFGPAEPGPHQLVIRSGKGVTIRPSARSYLRRWSPACLFRPREADADRDHWGIFVDNNSMPVFETATSLIVGSNLGVVCQVAAALGEWRGREANGHIWIRVGGKPRGMRYDGLAVEEIPIWEPLSSHDDLLARVFGRLVSADNGSRRIVKVIVGDLRHLAGDPNEENVRSLLTTISDALRQARIPLVMFQSNGEPHDLVRKLADVLIIAGTPNQTASSARIITRNRSTPIETPITNLVGAMPTTLAGRLASG